MLLIFYVIILLRGMDFSQISCHILAKGNIINTCQKKNTTSKYFKVVGSQKLVDINSSFLENNRHTVHACHQEGFYLSVGSSCFRLIEMLRHDCWRDLKVTPTHTQ